VEYLLSILGWLWIGSNQMGKLGRRVGKIFSVALTAIVLGGVLLFVLLMAQWLIMMPIQWWNGKCSEVYTQTYRSKFQWFQPTCELRPESAEVLSEDDIEDLQNQLNDLKSQIEKTQELLKNSKKKTAD
jgi:5-bromo-4-chloroindolyl phosphate hydrolysis protein